MEPSESLTMSGLNAKQLEECTSGKTRSLEGQSSGRFRSSISASSQDLVDVMEGPENIGRGSI